MEEPLSLKERWNSDIESRDLMYEENPPEKVELTKEQIENYEKEFGVKLSIREHNID